MIRLILTIFLYISMLAAMPMSAQNRYALLVGISNYDTAKTGWERIHGTNDVALLKKALKGFSVETLLNEQATFHGIEEAINRLESKVTKGDIVYLHFSGHGQPFEDLDGDEPDGWDESFVPFDANMRFRKGRYEGQRHLTDDILHKHIIQIRRKLGSKGCLYVSVDACHSGESYMGDRNEGSMHVFEEDDVDIESEYTDNNYERGTAYGFSPNDRVYRPAQNHSPKNITIKPEHGLSPIVMFEACQQNQKSYEISIDKKGGGKIYCGLLSYALYKTITAMTKSLTSDTSWASTVETKFYALRPSYSTQRIVIERTQKTATRRR